MSNAFGLVGVGYSGQVTSFTGDTTLKTVFTLPRDCGGKSGLLCFLNGEWVSRTSYSVNGLTLTLSFGLAPGMTLDVVYIGTAAPISGSLVNRYIETYTATAGQTSFALSNAYAMSCNAVQCYVNGFLETNITEVDAHTIKFGSGLNAGDEVDFVITIANPLSPILAVNTQYNGSRNVADKLGDIVSVKDFGAKGDGVTDDTAAIQAALNSLGVSGGSIVIPNYMKCVVSSNLTIPANCHLVGPHKFVGSPKNNASAPYNNIGGTIILSASATITLSGGSSISGLLIYRYGMVFPSIDATSFAGTAITINGDDASIFSCMILGFNLAVYSNGYQRQRIEYLLGDNVNGIEITQCADIAYISNCHMWPFATIAASGGVLIRTGKAYYLHDLCDWAKLTNCFSFGYYRGFQVSNANSITLLSCGTDNLFSNSQGQNPNSIGIAILGSASDNRLIGCQTSAQDTAGVYIATNAGLVTSITNHFAWWNNQHGIFIDTGGDVSINGGFIRNSPNAITVNNATSKVSVDGVRFNTISSRPINLPIASTQISIGRNNYGDWANGSAVATTNLQVPSIASADPLSLPATGDYFLVTGTNNFGTLQGGWAGRRVTLSFPSGLTVNNGGASPTGMRLNGGTSWTAPAGANLSLIFNGSVWEEVGRKA